MYFAPFSDLPPYPDGVFQLAPVDLVATGINRFSVLLFNENPTFDDFSVIVNFKEDNIVKPYYVEGKIDRLVPHQSRNGQFIGFGPTGYLIWFNGDTVTDSNKLKELGITSRYGELTYAKHVSGHYVFLGMARQVYIVKSIDSPEFASSDILDESTERLHFSGFFATAGNADTLLVSGVGGETYSHTNSKWSRLNAPTNLDLYDICLTSNGEFVLGGHSGVLLLYRENFWYDLTDDVDLSGSSIRKILPYDKSLIMLTDDGIFHVSITDAEHKAVLDKKKFDVQGRRITGIDLIEHYLWCLSGSEVVRFDLLENRVDMAFSLADVVKDHKIQIS